MAMHGTPPVVATWRSFQDKATTETLEGRALMVAAIQATRAQLGHGPASDDDLHVLLSAQVDHNDKRRWQGHRAPSLTADRRLSAGSA
jgi:hypothetical protein